MKPKKNEENKEKESFTGDERSVRIGKLKELLELGIDPYPSSFALKRVAIHDTLKLVDGETVSIAGRLMGKRDIGKLTFGHLMDESGRVQIVLKQDELRRHNY